MARELPGRLAQGLPSYFAASSVLVVIGGLLIHGVWTGAAALTRLCLLVLTTALMTRLWGLCGLMRLRARVALDRACAFPDDPVRLSVHVTNAKVLPVWLQVVVPARAPRSSSLTTSSPNPADHAHDGSGNVRGITLAAYSETLLTWPLVAARRGVLQLGPITLEAGDMLGFHMSQRALGQREVVVYPRLLPLSPTPLPRREVYGNPGRGPVADMTNVQGLRDYQNGTPARHIDWKGSARMRKLLERVGQATTRKRVLLAVRSDGYEAGARSSTLDTCPDEPCPFERCLEVVASLAVSLARRGCAVGLVTNGRLVGDRPPFARVARGPEALAHLLEITGRLTRTADGDIQQRIERSGAWSHGCTLVCFGYTYDEAASSLQAWIARRGGSTHFVSCVETAAPVPGRSSLDDWLPHKLPIDDLVAHPDPAMQVP